MERDRRLTGFMRGQTDKPVAPEGFELNNPWRVGTEMLDERQVLTTGSASNDSSKRCELLPRRKRNWHTYTVYYIPNSDYIVLRKDHSIYGSCRDMQAINNSQRSVLSLLDF